MTFPDSIDFKKDYKTEFFFKTGLVQNNMHEYRNVSVSLDPSIWLKYKEYGFYHVLDWYTLEFMGVITIK